MEAINGQIAASCLVVLLADLDLPLVDGSDRSDHLQFSRASLLLLLATDKAFRVIFMRSFFCVVWRSWTYLFSVVCRGCCDEFKKVKVVLNCDVLIVRLLWLFRWFVFICLFARFLRRRYRLKSGCTLRLFHDIWKTSCEEQLAKIGSCRDQRANFWDFDLADVSV